MSGMIETLKPPTDSLYKFLSIIGLIIFISSVVTPIILNRQLNAQYAAFLRDANMNNLDAKTWEDTGKKSDRIEEQIVEVRRLLQEAVSPGSKTSLAETERLLGQLERLVKAQIETLALLKQQLHQWRKQGLEVEYNNNLLADTKLYTNRMFNLCLIAGPVGLVMSITGFALWYKRTQKYEDLVLRKKVEEPAESKIIIP